VNPTRSTAISLLIGILSGVLTGLLFYVLYRHGILDYDVSDGHGHGPDYGGAEWRGAFLPGIRRQSIFLGVFSCLLSTLFSAWLLMKKRPKPAPGPS